MPLVVAAVAAELGELPGRALGVGPVRAAASMARLIVENAPDSVILVGSCGAYGAVPVGAVRVASALGTGDAGAAVGRGYVPLPPPVLAADPALAGAVDAPGARVLTLAAITTDPAVAAVLGEDWDLEHMEAYSAAHACAAAGVPFVAVLGVANRVGPGAHDEWRRHRAAAEAAAQAAVLPLLSRS